MDWYPWLNASYRQLIGQYQAGRGHHAVLLHALPGMGDESLIYALSRWLICQQPDGMKSCGQCHSCNLMTAGTHPDWHVLSPEKGKQSLGVDPVRDVVEKVYQHSRQGGAKVIWLAAAEQLTEAAANALLKTLEEPPQNTFFLFGCREPARLLATLRSRCLYHYLDVPNETQSVLWLNTRHRYDSKALRTALRLQSGAPLAAEALLQPERWKQRSALCQAFSAALTSRDQLSLISQLNHDDADIRIHWLAALLLDAMKWQQGANEHLVNQDQIELVERLAREPSAHLQYELQQWLACRQKLLTVTGVNRELLLTERLLDGERTLASSVKRNIPPFSI
ncbi:DNA polymerase III subunit delta' [Pectobacterium brasiliense]|uniref:DNA polymerase III subunit delta' n=1 Tax=Pectobacterium brasiliense TaxID=180957 RepID=UPI0001A44D42|nr:DNA polymerase III subunit delta' [Pectobacterium brasiliense]KGA23741.1 DNA polymerase III subunit delta' [Pectobacterium brasiliense]KRF66159.1 DNA polymerase III subunit delta' [Pectobacterium brasiliense]MBN3185394.1 DNA polymerase III subunit delta' [Pectobacterium brasiliense]QHG30161.1 DNA polymerase III subunit delta' [Pectobacterium brasiliense]